MQRSFPALYCTEQAAAHCYVFHHYGEQAEGTRALRDCNAPSNRRGRRALSGTHRHLGDRERKRKTDPTPRSRPRRSAKLFRKAGLLTSGSPARRAFPAARREPAGQWLLFDDRPQLQRRARAGFSPASRSDARRGTTPLRPPPPPGRRQRAPTRGRHLPDTRLRGSIPRVGLPRHRQPLSSAAKSSVTRRQASFAAVGL